MSSIHNVDSFQRMRIMDSTVWKSRKTITLKGGERPFLCWCLDRLKAVFFLKIRIISGENCGKLGARLDLSPSDKKMSDSLRSNLSWVFHSFPIPTLFSVLLPRIENSAGEHDSARTLTTHPRNKLCLTLDCWKLETRGWKKSNAYSADQKQ